MEKSAIIFIILLGILVIIPTITLSISSYVIGIEYLNITCDLNGKDIIPLSSWLFINATTSLAITAAYVIILFVFMAKQEFKYNIAAFIIYLFNILWVIIWNIIGSIQLFEHSEDCIKTAKPIWVMTLLCLIFQWLSLFYIVIIKCFFLRESK